RGRVPHGRRRAGGRRGDRRRPGVQGPLRVLPALRAQAEAGAAGEARRVERPHRGAPPGGDRQRTQRDGAAAAESAAGALSLVFLREGACALGSEAADEPLAGTAATDGEVYFLLRYPGSWAPKALEGSDLPDAIKAQLLAAAKATRGRVLLFRGP